MPPRGLGPPARPHHVNGARATFCPRGLSLGFRGRAVVGRFPDVFNPARVGHLSGQILEFIKTFDHRLPKDLGRFVLIGQADKRPA
jgi:hypothetical protein